MEKLKLTEDELKKREEEFKELYILFNLKFKELINFLKEKNTNLEKEIKIEKEKNKKYMEEK